MGTFLLNSSGDFIVSVGGLLDTTYLSSPPASTTLQMGRSDPANATGPTESNIGSHSLGPTGSGTAYWVDTDVSSSGNGLTVGAAFKTIQEGLDAATTPGDRVIVRRSKPYRESCATAASGTSTDKIMVVRYGTDTPWISGAEQMSGFVAATSQADALGSPDWANCYVGHVDSSISLDSGQSTYRIGGNFNLTQTSVAGYPENRHPLHMALQGAVGKDDRRETFDEGSLYSPESYDDSTTSSTITDTVNLAQYQAGDLDNAYALIFKNASFVSAFRITNFNKSTHTITVDNSNTLNGGPGRTTFGKWPTKNSAQTGYRILNSARDLTEQGSWAFGGLNGSNERKVVVRPWGGDNLVASQAVEVSCREMGLAINHDYVGVYGIDFRQQSAELAGTTFNAKAATAIGTQVMNGPTSRTGITGEEMRIFDIMQFATAEHHNSHELGNGAIAAQNANSWEFKKFEIYRAMNGRSVGIQDSGNNVSIVAMRNFYIDECSQSGIRIAGKGKEAILDTGFLGSVTGQHPNALTVKLEWDSWLFVRLITRCKKSSFALQGSGPRGVVLGCDMETNYRNTNGQAVFRNSGTGTGSSSLSGEHWVLNTAFKPNDDVPTTDNAAAMTQWGLSTGTHNIANVVYHGGDLSNDEGGVKSHLVLTGFNSNNGQSSGNPLWGTATNSVVETTMSNIYKDYTVDARPVTGGVLDGTGKDISAHLAVIGTYYTQPVDLSYDIDGVAWTTNIGPYSTTID